MTEEEVNKVPHSFVMHRGEVGKSVLKLEVDIRRVMEPYTATKLKVNTVFVITVYPPGQDCPKSKKLLN